MTLTRRLLLLALISVLPAIAIWTYTEVSLRHAREAEVHDFALRQAQLASSELERIFEGIHSLLIAIAEVPSVRGFADADCMAYLQKLQVRVPYLDAIIIVGADGQPRCQEGAAPQVSFNDKDYFQEALKTSGLVTGEYTRGLTDPAAGGRPVLPLALSFHNEDKQIAGVVIAALDLNWLDGQLKARAVPEGGSVTISDRNGIIVAREPLSERFIGTQTPEMFMKYVHDTKAGSFEAVSQDGIERVLGYIPGSLTSTGLYVSAGISSKIAFEGINRAARRGFMLIGAGLVLALSLSGLIGRVFVTRPFDIMMRAMRAWRQGHYDARIELHGSPGELGVLASGFNELMTHIAERQKDLKASEERARLALEAGQMGTWWFDHRSQSSGWSPQAAQLLGFPADTSPLSASVWRSLLHPEDADRVFENLRTAMMESGDYEDEYRMRRPDGELRWFSASGRTFFDEAHQPVSTIGVFQDITTRKHAAEQQQLLLDELNHRVKNTLATVQSIASQTLRSAKSGASFKEAFDNRLFALSKTHDLLTQNSWRAADLHAIAEQELAPYRRDQEQQRVSINGPRIDLHSRMAINFGLILHELMTNAVKYGALSNNQGRIMLKWSIEASPEGPPCLKLQWLETNGPPVTEPRHQGFGSRLIRRSVEGELGGSVEISYPSSGLICEIIVPLD